MSIARKSLIWLVFLIGLATRLYLAAILPMWHDEAYSLWASTTPIKNILLGMSDPVHPPGYYIFVKFWSIFSDSLFWARVSTLLLFSCNVYLLYQIGKHIKDSVFALILVLLYSFSGYFVIFDWQVRMYTAVTACILGSLWIIQKKLYDIRLVALTIINFLGLYIDYAFLWYFLPLLVLVCVQTMVHKKETSKVVLISLLISLFGFILCHVTLVATYMNGLMGISWMKLYLSPYFFVPFFLGTHDNSLLFAYVSYIFALFGASIVGQSKDRKPIYTILFFSSLASFVGTYSFSLFVTPVFHVRSLQIIGIALIFLIAEALYALYKNNYMYALSAFIGLFVVNYILIFQGLFFKSDQYMVSFFPWKQTRKIIEERKFDYVAFKQTSQTPSYLFTWGLQYSLDGKETIFSKKIPYKDISLQIDPAVSCVLITQNLLDIYGCKN